MFAKSVRCLLRNYISQKVYVVYLCVCVNCICIAVSSGLIELIYYNCNASGRHTDRQTERQRDSLLDRQLSYFLIIHSERYMFILIKERRWLN